MASTGGVMYLDCHTHTKFSHDCSTELKDYIRAAEEANLEAVCVTDHNTIRGGLEIRELDPPFRVVVGSELRTISGDLIGLFLEREVESHMPISRTAREIKEQGGITYLPHPFDRFADTPGLWEREELLTHLDVVEVHNSRLVFDSANRRAAAFAAERGVPGGAGSDAHRPEEIGLGGVELRSFDGPQELVSALATARVLRRDNRSAGGRAVRIIAHSVGLVIERLGIKGA